MRENLFILTMDGKVFSEESLIDTLKIKPGSYQKISQEWIRFENATGRVFNMPMTAISYISYDKTDKE